MPIVKCNFSLKKEIPIHVTTRVSLRGMMQSATSHHKMTVLYDSIYMCSMLYDSIYMCSEILKLTTTQSRLTGARDWGKEVG